MAKRRVDVWLGTMVVGALAIAACGEDSGELDPAGAAASLTASPEAEPSETGPPDSEPVDTEPVDTVSPPGSTVADTVGAAEGEEDGLDVCALLGGVDVDGLLGEPVGAQEFEEDPSGGVCTVTPLDPESRGSLGLSVSTNAPEANYENAQELFGVDAELAGLGEQAFVSGGMVVVLAGEYLVSLQPVRWRDLGIGGVTQPELEAAARVVVDALGPSERPVDGLACSLLEGIDVEALIGEPVGAPTIGAGNDACVVPPVDPESDAFVSLTVIGAQARQRFDETEKIFGVDAVVDGLGDEAFHSGPVLAVLSGDQAFLLWMMGDIMNGANVDDAELEAVMAQILESAGG